MHPKEEIARPTFSKEQIIFFLERFKGGDVNDQSYQRQIIDTFVSRIWIYDDKTVITYNYSGEGNTITLEAAEKPQMKLWAGVRLSSRHLHHESQVKINAGLHLL